MQRRTVITLFAVSAIFYLPAATRAQTFKSHPVKIPGSSNVFVEGINDSSEMVANYTDAAGTSHCATISGSTITEIADPNAVGTGPGRGTSCFGINNSGQVTGSYSLALWGNGFVYTGGQYVDIIVPTATAGTVAVGINNVGNITGYFSDNVGSHGFFYVVQTNTYTQLDVPGATQSLATYVNDGGETTLQWLDSTGNRHGEIYLNGHYKTLDVPGAFQSAAEGIDNLGQIVFHAQDSSGIYHGYYYSHGTFTQFDATNGSSGSTFRAASTTTI